MTDMSATQGSENLVTPGTNEGQVSQPAGGQEQVVTQQPQAVQPTWREDWRQALSKGDDKVLQRLGRFNSPEQIWESYTNLEKKLSGNQFKPELPKDRDATPEELSAYRKAYGIPEQFNGYYEHLDPEMVVDGTDEAAINTLMKEMHALNAPPQYVKAAVDTYYKSVSNLREQAHEAQMQIKEQSEEALRKEWGPEFKSNINALRNFLQGAPEDVQGLLAEATLSDGSLAMNNANFIRWMVGLVREINPHMTVVGPGQGDVAGNIDSQIAELKALMSQDINAWHHPSNAANKDRYYKLLQAKEKVRR